MSEAEEPDRTRSDGSGTGPTRSFDRPALVPGRRLGPFRIERELGRGAMGVVYLAHDTKLNRSVAIKSLPAELMEHAQARTRFAREARVLASLNHPNVATLYDELHEADGIGYLVLEYVPGQTLAERIARARLKPQEALAIAEQIAKAVSAAHECQVIHRDLKPGNIKITPQGRIKVLDFGLAKALRDDPEQESSTVTQPGRIMGTPAYMSPEQVRGLETDQRCDIWSFGCVLFEMLTGKTPFEGPTASDTLAGILDRKPDWNALPQTTPANIKVLLRRCLEKDTHRRLHDIADAAIEINETLSGTSETYALPGQVASASRFFRRDVILFAVACLIAGALIAGAVLYGLVKSGPPKPAAVSRLPIRVSPDYPLYTGAAPNYFLAISPDGTRLVYIGRSDDGHTGLFTRPMSGFQIEPLPGTTDAHNPFFSPDGQWVGFFTEGQLKIVPVTGGEPLTLLENVTYGVTGFGSWAEDGTIVFSVADGARGLQRISANQKGQAETLIAPDPDEAHVYYRYPQVLPGGKAVLYSHVSRRSRIEVFLPAAGKRQVVLDDASYALYVRSGHLVFVRDNVLMAAPFDVRQLRITGPLAFIVDDVLGFDGSGETPQITVSHDGTAVYMSGSELGENELVWVDSQGAPVSLGAPADLYENPRLSPDGQQIAMGVRSEKEFTNQVRVYHTLRGTLTHLTTEGGERYPQWSPDGMRIAFWSRRTEGAGVYCRVVGSSAAPELLASEPSPGVFLFPYSWSRNANLIACTVLDPNTQDDIWIIDLERDPKPKLFLGTEYKEYNPALSPDGHWLAFVSDETSRPEIYLREYPNGERQEMVSTDGGTNPSWSRDGRRLYYISGIRMMCADVTLEPELDVGAPGLLFESPEVVVSGFNLGRQYDVSDDGRFLMIKSTGGGGDRLVCVHNWFEDLRRLAPPTKGR